MKTEEKMERIRPSRDGHGRIRNAPQLGEKIKEKRTGYRIVKIHYRNKDNPNEHPQKSITEKRRIG